MEQKEEANIITDVCNYIWNQDYKKLYDIVINQLSSLQKKPSNIYKIIAILVENCYVKEALDLYNKIDASKHNKTMDKYLKNAIKIDMKN